MKKIENLLLILAALSLSLAAEAGQGKATAPHFQIYKDSNGNLTATTVMVTNITDHPVRVSVHFYGKDGTLIPSTYCTFHNFINSNTELAANSSGYVYVAPSSNVAINYGKFVVEWENLGSENDTVALLGHAYVFMDTGAGRTRFSVPINGGTPF